jgi:hypothetical protein
VSEVTANFSTSGEKELILNVYDGSGLTLVRREILRVQVMDAFVVTSVQFSDTEAQLTWAANSGTTYRVWYSTNLVSDLWAPLGAPVPAVASGLLTVTVSNVEGGASLRVQVE